MKKNAKLAPLQTPLRQVAIFLHNADFPHLRVTKPPPNSPAERCCFALGIGSVRGNSNDCNAGRKEVDSVREKTYNHKYIQVTGKGEGMVLFYGSKEIVVYPSIRKSIYNRDFYFGFYCTANKEQAERCAIRYEKKGYVNRYNYIPNPALKYLKFERITDEWLDFIVACRAGKAHTCDIVEGPMVDDAIFNYVQDFVDGKITRVAFWELVKYNHPIYQISFHTISALDTLTFRGSETVYRNKNNS